MSHLYIYIGVLCVGQANGGVGHDMVMLLVKTRIVFLIGTYNCNFFLDHRGIYWREIVAYNDTKLAPRINARIY